MTTHELKLTPLVRWLLSFSNEVQLFPQAYNLDFLEKLEKRSEVAESRQSMQAQSLLRLDLILFFITTSPNYTSLEFAGLKFSQLYLLADVALLGSSLVFFFLVWNIINKNAYDLMAGAVCEHLIKDPDWNPDYFKAGYVQQELVLFISRARLQINVDKPERLEAGSRIYNAERSVAKSFAIVIVPLIAMHLLIQGYAIYSIYRAPVLGPTMDFPIVAFSIAATVLAFYVNYILQSATYSYTLNIGQQAEAGTPTVPRSGAGE